MFFQQQLNVRQAETKPVILFNDYKVLFLYFRKRNVSQFLNITHILVQH